MTKRPPSPPNLSSPQTHSPYSTSHHQPPTTSTSPTNPPLDPAGEEAYLAAFASAAKMKPPRIPNPLAYPNSPSAVENITSRTAKFTQHAPPVRVPNSTYVAPPPDVHSLRRAARRRMEAEGNGQGHGSGSGSGSPSVQADLTWGDMERERRERERERERREGIRAPPHHQQYAYQHPEQPPRQQQHSSRHEHPSSYHHQQPQQQQQQGGSRHRGPYTLEPQIQAPTGPRNPFR